MSDFAYGDDCCGTGLVSGKVRAVQLYACRSPEGSRGVRLPDFKTIGT